VGDEECLEEKLKAAGIIKKKSKAQTEYRLQSEVMTKIPYFKILRLT
jgi:hypothetical protein